jgi:hypothetical protein
MNNGREGIMKYSDETIGVILGTLGFEERATDEEIVHEIFEALESTDEQIALRADAERWRYWLREHGWSGYFDDGLTNSESDGDIIAACDKARGA